MAIFLKLPFPVLREAFFKMCCNMIKTKALRTCVAKAAFLRCNGRPIAMRLAARHLAIGGLSQCHRPPIAPLQEFTIVSQNIFRTHIVII